MSQNEPLIRCINCRFCHIEPNNVAEEQGEPLPCDQSIVGECRRNTPYRNGQYQRFPIIYPRVDWCGEFEYQSTTTATLETASWPPAPGTYASLPPTIPGTPHPPQ